MCSNVTICSRNCANGNKRILSRRNVTLSVWSYVSYANPSNCTLGSWINFPWWHHQLGTFSAFLAFCAGNSPATSEFPAQRPVTRSFDVFFDLRLNKPLSKQSWGWWFETLSGSLWRHCNVIVPCEVGQLLAESATKKIIPRVAVDDFLNPSWLKKIIHGHSRNYLFHSLATNMDEYPYSSPK